MNLIGWRYLCMTPAPLYEHATFIPLLVKCQKMEIKKPLSISSYLLEREEINPEEVLSARGCISKFECLIGGIARWWWRLNISPLSYLSHISKGFYEILIAYHLKGWLVSTDDILRRLSNVHTADGLCNLIGRAYRNELMHMTPWYINGL